MRDVRGQVAAAQRLHRRNNGGNAARDIANQVNADGDSDDDGDAENGGKFLEGGSVVVGGVLARLVGAGVVEFDALFQDGVGVQPDLVHRLRIQLMRLMGKFAGGLARQ